MARQYWLMKSEPEAYSFEDLMAEKNRTDHWDGIRNYQARNFMMEMRQGDALLFYHSSTHPPHVAGIAEVAREAYPDHTSWDKKAKYYDPKSTPENPRWYMVDNPLAIKEQGKTAKNGTKTASVFHALRFFPVLFDHINDHMDSRRRVSAAASGPRSVSPEGS